MSDIGSWLRRRGLARYEQILAENEIDLEVLSELEEADLEKIGLALGPRKKLLKAIRELERSRDSASTPAPTLVPPSSAEAERRQLTVMFADMVDSTALSQTIDPEDLRDINRTFQTAVTAAIQRYGGYVARYMGDGVLVYFGYPLAHEDDAERALRAGLEIVHAVPELDTGVVLAVRVGVATGTVVVGDIVGEGAAQESAVIGETPNLAARLQSIAEANTVVASEATEHLVAGRFDLDALGPQELKGMTQPVCAYRVRGVRAVSRFDAAHARRTTPLIGRDEELGILLRRWQLAREAEGPVVLLCGEAGVGKSRIEVRARRGCLERSRDQTGDGFRARRRARRCRPRPRADRADLRFLQRRFRDSGPRGGRGSDPRAVLTRASSRFAVAQTLCERRASP